MESKIKEILNYLPNIKVIAPTGAKIALPENCVGVEISKTPPISTAKLRKPEQKPTKPSSPKSARKRKRKQKKKEDSGEKTKKMRPTHFISLRVTSSEIHKKVAAIQEKFFDSSISEKNLSSFKRSLIPLDQLHVSLNIIGVKKEQEAEFKDCIQTLQAKFKNAWQRPLSCEFSALNHFNSGVLYIPIINKEATSTLAQIFDDIESECTKRGIYCDSSPFVPHLTILKASRIRRMNKTMRKYFKAIFKGKMETFDKTQNFGMESVTYLDICGMKKGADGTYYHVDNSIPFFGNTES